MEPRLLCAIFVAIDFTGTAISGYLMGKNIREKFYDIAGGYFAVTLLFTAIFLVTMIVGMFL